MRIRTMGALAVLAMTGVGLAACPAASPEQQAAGVEADLTAIMADVQSLQVTCDQPMPAFRDLAARAAEGDQAASDQATYMVIDWRDACEGQFTDVEHVSPGWPGDVSAARDARDLWIRGAMMAYWAGNGWQNLKNTGESVETPEALVMLDEYRANQARLYAEGDAMMAQALEGTGVTPPSLAASVG